MSERPPVPWGDVWGQWPEPPPPDAPRTRASGDPSGGSASRPPAPRGLLRDPDSSWGNGAPRQVRRPSSVPAAPATYPPTNRFGGPGYPDPPHRPPHRRLELGDEWAPVTRPAPGYSPPTTLPTDYPSEPHQTGELPAVAPDAGLSLDLPPPSWPEYQASLVYSDVDDEPAPTRRRKAPLLAGLLLVVAAGAGGAVWWLGQDDDVQISDTSTGGDAPEVAAGDPTPTTTPASPERSARDRTSSESSDDGTPDAAEEPDATEPTETTETPGSEGGTDDAGTDPGNDDSGNDPGPGPDPGEAGSPGDAVEAMFVATNNTDCPALLDSLSADSRAMFGSTPEMQVSECETTMSLAPPSDMTIESLSVTSETEQEATVQTTHTENGNPTNGTFHVVREDGAWKVNLAAG